MKRVGMDVLLTTVQDDWMFDKKSHFQSEIKIGQDQSKRLTNKILVPAPHGPPLDLPLDLQTRDVSIKRQDEWTFSQIKVLACITPL